MTPIIYLEVADDLGSTLTKVNRIKATEFILAIPVGSALIHSALNLKILKQYLDNTNRSARISVADKIGSTLAELAGFEVTTVSTSEDTSTIESNFPEISIGENIEMTTDDEFKEEPLPNLNQPPSQSVRRLSAPSFGSLIRPTGTTKLQLRFSRQHQITLGLVLVGLTMLIVVGYFIVPRATITLEVQSEKFKKQLSLVLADKQDLQAAGPNILTGRFLEITRESVSTFSATGEKNDGNKAEGKITIFNHTGSIEGLLANTRFKSANGLVFRLKNEILISPARNRTPGRATADVVADEGGTKYNITSGVKLSIPGLNATAQALVYGETANTFSGGTDIITKVVSQEDINKAKEAAAKNVFVEAEAELQKQLKRNEELVPAFIQNDVIDSMPNVSAGATNAQFEIRVQSRSWTIAILKNELQTAIANAATFEVPEGKQITQRTIDTAKVNVVEGNFLTHRINLSVVLDGRVGPSLDMTSITNHLVNQSLVTGKSYLQSINNIASSEIVIWPKFISRIPLLSSNIKLNVVYLGE